MNALLLLLSLSIPGAWAAAAAPGFVTVSGARFMLDGKPYRFLGANLWYAMNLGAEGPGGDRARLSRELDRLKALGVNNLRIIGITEGPDSEPLRITPPAQPRPGVLDERLMRGLDFAIAEMGKRGQKVVIILNNFWPWSGGMAQYLSWAGRGPIPYPPPGADWDDYQKFTAAFYSNPKALAWSRQAMKTLITRRNTVTHGFYRDDPAIMAWQLANEPRGIDNRKAFETWLDEASRFVKSLDSRHLVSTGCEGQTPRPAFNGVDFVADHSPPSVDYATIHIWAQNWGWFDPARSSQTYSAAVLNMRSYLRSHLERAQGLGKPVVLEEFGLARDSGSYEPSSGTSARDDYYAAVFEEVYRLAAQGAPISGVSFWAWAGEGRPRRPGTTWKPGDPWTGDPPHEPQGWYGIYDTDKRTVKLIARWARRFAALDARPATIRPLRR